MKGCSDRTSTNRTRSYGMCACVLVKNYNEVEIVKLLCSFLCSYLFVVIPRQKPTAAAVQQISLSKVCTLLKKVISVLIATYVCRRFREHSPPHYHRRSPSPPYRRYSRSPPRFVATLQLCAMITNCFVQGRLSWICTTTTATTVRRTLHAHALYSHHNLHSPHPYTHSYLPTSHQTSFSYT